MLMNIPVSYILLRNGAIAEITVVVAIVFSLLCLVARLVMLRRMIGLSVKDFLTDVCLRIILVSSASVILPVLAAGFLPDGHAGVLINVLICLASAGSAAVFLGLNKNERNELVAMFRKGGDR